jgi:hypothetical protein
MTKKKGFMQSWRLLEISLLSVILALFAGTGVLGCTVLIGDREADQTIAANPPVVATLPPAVSATDTPAPFDDGQNAAQPNSAVLTLTPDAGSAGSTVKVNGQGFPVNSRVVIYLVPKDPPNFALNSAVVGADGSFSVEIIVPSDPRWLNENPVPVLAEAVDTGVKGRPCLTLPPAIPVSRK